MPRLRLSERSPGHTPALVACVMLGVLNQLSIHTDHVFIHTPKTCSCRKDRKVFMDERQPELAWVHAVVAEAITIACRAAVKPVTSCDAAARPNDAVEAEEMTVAPGSISDRVGG